MGAMLLFLAVIISFFFIGSFFKKIRRRKRTLVISLGSIAVLLWAGFWLYITPFQFSLPNDCSVAIRDAQGIFWMDDTQYEIWLNAETSQQIGDLLGDVYVKRELAHNDGIFPPGEPVQDDDYFILTVHQPDSIEQGNHGILYEISFVCSEPDRSRVILPSNNNRNKYEIVNPATLLQTIQSIIGQRDDSSVQPLP